MKTFQAFVFALLICASTTVGALAYSPESFPGKGNRAQYNAALKFASSGVKFFDQEKYREAIAEYSKAIAVYPYDAGVHCNKGLSHAALDDHKQAVVEFRKAISLEPSWFPPYNNLSDELKILKDYQGAADACKQALAIDPAAAVPHVTLAEIYIETGRFEEAKKLLIKASRLKASTPTEQQAVNETIQADLRKIPGNVK